MATTDSQRRTRTRAASLKGRFDLRLSAPVTDELGILIEHLGIPRNHVIAMSIIYFGMESRKLALDAPLKPALVDSLLRLLDKVQPGAVAQSNAEVTAPSAPTRSAPPALAPTQQLEPVDEKIVQRVARPDGTVEYQGKLGGLVF